MDSDKRQPLKYMGAHDVFPIHRVYIIYYHSLVKLIYLAYLFWVTYRALQYTEI